MSNTGFTESVGPTLAQQAVDAPLKVGAATLTSVTPTGGVAGAYTYKIVGLDADGNHTAASAGVSDAAGPTTLDGTHFETLLWTDPVGASNVAVYRTAGGATQGLIATVAAGVGTLVDNGLVADGSTAPSSDTTGVGTGLGVGFAAPYAWVYGTFVATVQIQALAPDGTTWVNVGSALTGPGYVEVPTCLKVRSKMTAYTSGTPQVKLLSNSF